MVKNIALSFIFVLVSILPTLGNSISPLPPDFNFTDCIVLPAVDSSIVIRQRQIEINRNQLSDEKVKTIHLDLFNDVSVEILLEKHRRTPDGGLIWQGTIVGQPGSTVLFVLNDARVSGDIFFSETLYQVRSLADGIHIVQEVKTISIRRDVKTTSKRTDDVIALTNQERAKYGLPALTYNTQLTESAQGHAADMAENNYFSHTSQDGRTFSDRITAAGYTWNSAAENIAAGYSTAVSVVDGWINSPGHYANMLSTTFCDIGVGYANNTAAAYAHSWVQNFGRQSGVTTCPATPPGQAPDVVTGKEIQVSTDSVNLTGTVNPNGLTTTYYFEIGYTTAYGTTSSTYNAGSGISPLSVQFTPSGFLPETTYHYRVVASNSIGTTYGNDVVFRTRGQNQGKLQIGSLLLLLL